MYDLLIVGGGPAGISAALTAHSRGRTTLLISNSRRGNPLYRAQVISNYPGMDGVSGARMLDDMHHQLQSQGIASVEAKVVQILSTGGHFVCAAGSEIYEGRSLLLAVGNMPKATVGGEDDFLGRGVSYCATCDGMLYRGRTVAVLGFGPDAPEEANFLAGIGCCVLYFGKGERPAELHGGIEHHQAAQYIIRGTAQRITGLEADGYLYPVDGVFILRASVAADSLLLGLEMRDGHIAVSSDLSTSVPGVYAAGDCVGKPYQIAKAVGEGNVAALSIDRWLEQMLKGEH